MHIGCFSGWLRAQSVCLGELLAWTWTSRRRFSHETTISHHAHDDGVARPSNYWQGTYNRHQSSDPAHCRSPNPCSDTSSATTIPVHTLRGDKFKINRNGSRTDKYEDLEARTRSENIHQLHRGSQKPECKAVLKQELDYQTFPSSRGGGLCPARHVADNLIPPNLADCLEEDKLDKVGTVATVVSC